MKIGQIIDEKMSRYSFHFLSLSFWYFILIFVMITVIAMVGSMENIQFGQVIFWCTMFSYPPIVLPLLITMVLCIYIFLRKKEQKFQDFRINDEFLTKNILYRIFIIFSLCLTLTSSIFLIFGLFYINIVMTNSLQLFIIVGLPLLVCFITIYFLVEKYYFEIICLPSEKSDN